MKKRRRLTMKNLIKFFMVMAVLCMTACSQTFEDVSNNAKPQEKGRLVMNVGSRSRTIMPTVDTLKSNIKSATLTANNTKIRSWSGDNVDNVIGQIESDNSILLDVGTYNFEMKFYNGTNDVILSGTINNQDIKTGDNELTFDMKIAGNGNISIELSRGADSGISKIKAGLYNIATGEAVKNYEPEELTISDTQVTYSKDDVPAGQYIIKFEIYDATNKLLNTLTDVIEVIGGITTTDQITLNKINTQYTITYNLDGGEWKGFTPITKRNANTKVTLPTVDNIEKENFILAGWYDGKGNIITEIPSDTTGDITVTARWGITSEAAISKIKNLSGSETYDIVIGGTITSETISGIKTALQNNSSAKVNLDLSVTTGLISLGNSAFDGCSSLTSVIIPDSVTSIGKQAFNGCTGLTSVTIPDSVTSIGEYVFQNCSKLTSVEIPDRVTSIGNSAFGGCSSLKSVTIPDSVKEIGNRAFDGCGSLESVTIPDSVTSIGNRAFQNCSRLESVTIPDSVTSIGDSAFEYCGSLKSVTIGNKVTTIGDGVFRYCGSLESVTIPDSVTSIGDSAFYNCSNLTSVIIGDKVESIGRSTFQNCGSLKSVIIGNNVTTIGGYAFENCSNLESVAIPNSVESIGECAFSACKSLTTVNYAGKQVQWEEDIYIETSGNSALNKAAINYNTITVTASKVSDAISRLRKGSYTIIVTGAITSDTISAINTALQSNSKANVNLDLSKTTGELISIGDSAFQNCSNLTSVTIGDSVESIGYEAFYNCSSLTSVTIGNNVTSIGEKAFLSCRSLTSVIIGDNVTTIGEAAFSCCSFTNVTIPDSVTSIGNYAFARCSSLTSVHITDLTAWMNIKFENGNSNPLYNNGAALYLNDTLVTDLVIPDSVSEIGNYAFAGCSSLTSVTIGDSVTSIGNEAFRGCTGLTSVTIGDSVTSIGNSAFYGCTGLTSVTIPDSVTSIDYYAFYGCSSLTSVEIPDSVTTIGQSAFERCTGLTSVEIPDSVTSIGYRAFESCTGLTSVAIPNSVKSIGESAFKNCSSLTSVEIPDSVTTIHGFVFEYCGSLTSVTIPAGVTSIGNYVFNGCSSLTTVNYKGTQEQWEQISFGSDNGNLTNATINYNTITVTASEVSDTISNLTEGGSYTIIVTDAIGSETISAIKTALTTLQAKNSNAMVNLDLSETTGLESIGQFAFQDCSSLTSVTIPDGVTSIGSSAFEYCGSLESVTIPDGVTSIGDSAFNGCSSLTSVTIPDGVTSIGDSAFYCCDNLTTVNYKGTQEEWNKITGINQFGNVTMNYYSFKVTANDVSSKISDLTEGGSYTIIVTGAIASDTISAINTALQSNSKAMVNLDLSGTTGLTSIDIFAFSECTGLTSVKIPNSVESIGKDAFKNCSSLESVTIGNSVTSIYNYAFYNCSSLTSVTIPNSVTTIGVSAFEYCGSLTTVNYKGTEEQWGQISKNACNEDLTNATINYNYTE